jgi:hypothetical protein
MGSPVAEILIADDLAEWAARIVQGERLKKYDWGMRRHRAARRIRSSECGAGKRIQSPRIPVDWESIGARVLACSVMKREDTSWVRRDAKIGKQTK